MNLNIENWEQQIIEFLKNKIRSNEIKYEDFENVVKKYKDLSLKIQEFLEYAYKNSKDENKEKLYKLYKKFSLQNTGEIVEKLREIGFALKNNEKIYERFYDSEKKKPKGISYRIMELTRLGKREEVFFTLLNEFQGENFPKLLSDAFNPVYSDELFKTFIYSFLSGILGEKEQGGEE
ncbi:MAG: hypothetical protein ABIN23_07200 [candidate division WOR-3 bacterium]|nr:hypothetical protein [Candidatus Omnitrophota bacterium]